MKSLLLPALFLAAFSTCAAPSRDSFNIASVEAPGRLERVTLNDAHIELSLPQAWQSKPEFHERTGSMMFLFHRKAVYDSQGRRVVPSLGVLVEDVPDGVDLVEYSTAKRTQASQRDMSSIKLAWASAEGPGSLCYVAEYLDPGGISHKAYLFHTLSTGKGVQIIIDGTESVFNMLDPEYRLIIGRLRYID